MEDRLAEREAIEASGVLSIEPSGVGYSEESEEKECSDMAVVGVTFDVGLRSTSHQRVLGVADSGTWRGG